MTKKNVLKWICVAAATCSLYSGAVSVSAEETASLETSKTETSLQSSATENVQKTEATTPATDPTQTESVAATADTASSPTNTETAQVDPTSDEAPARTTEEKQLPTEFRTDFDSFDDATMEQSDWANGNPFDNRWIPENTVVKDGILTLTLDDKGRDGYKYTSGEWRTREFFGFGKFEVKMKAIKNPGVVSSFFTYTGPSDNNPWDEVDIEFLGKDTTKVQFNYFTNGHGEHEYSHELGFDASEDFHTYAFDWQKDSITWYVDGVAVHTATVDIPQTPGKIMMNAWPGTGVDEWLEPYDGKTPLVAYYDWVSYKAKEDVTPNEGKQESDNTPPVEENQAPVVDDNKTVDTGKADATVKTALTVNTTNKPTQAETGKKEATSVKAEAKLPSTGTKDSFSLLLSGLALLVVTLFGFAFSKKEKKG